MEKSLVKKCPICGKEAFLEGVAVEDCPFHTEALLKRRIAVDLIPLSNFEARRAFKKKRLADKKALKMKRRLNKKGPG